MRWFKTPEEYMAYYEPERLTCTPSKDAKRCPKCGNTNPQKLTTLSCLQGPFRFSAHKWARIRLLGKIPASKISCYTTDDRYVCERCLHMWPMSHALLRQTPEEFVFGAINNCYAATKFMLGRGGTPEGFIHVKRGLGAWGSLALVESFSNNLNAAKNGMLLGGMTMYERHQQHQQMDAEVTMFESEAQRAWDMAREYFHVPEREAAAARAIEIDQMREMGRTIASEMVAEVRRQSVSVHDA